MMGGDAKSGSLHPQGKNPWPLGNGRLTICP